MSVQTTARRHSVFHRLTVSGNNASRVLRVGSGVSVDIDDLTIAHGRADNGAGIWNAGGSLSLTHVIVSQNQAQGAPDSRALGGGVFNQGGTLTVAHSTFSANVVAGGLRLGATVTPGQGGGIQPATGAPKRRRSASEDSLSRMPPSDAAPPSLYRRPSVPERSGVRHTRWP